MTDAEKKIVCNCKGSKGKDVIVITIETCCRKTCDGLTAEKKPPAATPAISHGAKSATKLSERGDAVINSEPDSEVPKPDPVPEHHAKEEEHEKTKTKNVERENKRVFKLPILLERHHGPGCAMEINVLEKHENSCMYKKDEVDGRTPEDRVGSYECIGRLVFRTCNPNELEADSGGISSVNGGASPTAINTYKSLGQLPSIHTPPPSPQLSIQGNVSSASNPSVVEAAPGSSVSTPTVIEANKPPEPGNDYVIVDSKSQELHSFKKTRSSMDSQRIMMLTTPNIPEYPGNKRHFPGDDCRLHVPKIPPQLSPLNEKIFASKKIFPSFADEGNQTEFALKNAETTTKRSKQSLETIASLSDLSKQLEKPKKTFFGSLFRKTSSKSTDGSRKFSSRRR